jgi:hypothetical protein
VQTGRFPDDENGSLAVAAPAPRPEDGSKPPWAEPAEAEAEEKSHDRAIDQARLQGRSLPRSLWFCVYRRPRRLARRPAAGQCAIDGHINFALFALAATALLVCEGPTRVYDPTMLD